MLTYGNFSPSEVRSMYNGIAPVNQAATRNTVSVYRLVKTDRWAVLMLSDNPDWTPVVGQNYRLLIYPVILILVMLFRPQGLMGIKEISFVKVYEGIPGFVGMLKKKVCRKGKTGGEA